MKAGAVDFLTKPVEEEPLLAAVTRAIARSTAAQHGDRERADFQTRLARLTPRERQVGALVIQGLLNKQIAGELGTAEKTVKVHRARVMDKLEVGSVAELARLAERTHTLAVAAPATGTATNASNGASGTDDHGPAPTVTSSVDRAAHPPLRAAATAAKRGDR
jgi:DNA-binding CsgD family transcriptional regulator